MSSRRDAVPDSGRPGGDWVMLAQQLPGGPSNARVKTWRRLRELGAVSLRNAVYVLPNSAQAREDFAWLRQEIIAMGGQATVVAGDVVDAEERAALVELFQRARSEDFAALRKDIERVIKATRDGRAEWSRDASRQIAALRERLLAIQRADVFAAPGGDEARQAMAELEARMARKHTTEPRRLPPVAKKKDYRNRIWVTRSGPGVDRMASAWLIRRFIDPAATFAFTEREHEPPADQVPFDMFVGEFSHQGNRCTFEVLLERFDLNQPALRRIGEIVHDIDLKDSRFNRPETAVIGSLVDGIRAAAHDDADALQQGATVFEGAYRSFDSAAHRSRGRVSRRGAKAGRRRAR